MREDRLALAAPLGRPIMTPPTDGGPDGDPLAMHPKLQRLFDYWQRLRGDRAMPARRDIDPTDIPSLLANVLVTEIVDPAGTYRFRLAGTGIRDMAGVEVTGKRLDEILEPGPYFDYLVSIHKDVAAAARPLFTRTAVTTREGTILRTTGRLVMPLSSDGETVDALIGGMYLDDGLAWPPVATSEPAMGFEEIARRFL
jgi:hypothetical protein